MSGEGVAHRPVSGLRQHRGRRWSCGAVEGDGDQYGNQLSQDTLVPRQSVVSSEGWSVKDVVSVQDQAPLASRIVCCTECGQQLHGDEWFCAGCGSFQSEPTDKPESSDQAPTRTVPDSRRPAEELTVCCDPVRDARYTVTHGFVRDVVRSKASPPNTNRPTRPHGTPKRRLGSRSLLLPYREIYLSAPQR